MQVKANFLANELWSIIIKTKQSTGKFTVNGFVHVYRRIAQSCYRIDEAMSIYFLTEPMNY